MSSAKPFVVVLWFGTVLASSLLLSPRRGECVDQDLSHCRGSDWAYWFNGCISCAAENLSQNNEVDGTCNGCNGAPPVTYCIICADYTLTYDSAALGGYDMSPGFIEGDGVPCNDGETQNKTLYKCNNGICTGAPMVIGTCVNDVVPWDQEF